MTRMDAGSLRTGSAKGKRPSPTVEDTLDDQTVHLSEEELEEVASLPTVQPIDPLAAVSPDVSDKGATSAEEDSEQAGSGRIRYPMVPIKLILTDEQEQNVGKWYRDHPILYDKGRRDYRDNTRKSRLYEEKARSLVPPLTSHQLTTWINSMRTRYARLTNEKKKRGHGAARRSHRDKWILRTFGFLHTHIRRVNSRQMLEPPPAAPSTITTRAPDTVDLSDDEAGARDTTPEPLPATSGVKGTSKRRRSPQEQEEEMMRPVMTGGREMNDFRERIEVAVTSKTNMERSARAFAAFLGEHMMDLEPLLFDDFACESMALLYKYRMESRKYRLAASHPPCPPHPATPSSATRVPHVGGSTPVAASLPHASSAPHASSGPPHQHVVGGSGYHVPTQPSTPLNLHQQPHTSRVIEGTWATPAPTLGCTTPAHATPTTQQTPASFPSLSGFGFPQFMGGLSPARQLLESLLHSTGASSQGQDQHQHQG